MDIEYAGGSSESSKNRKIYCPSGWTTGQEEKSGRSEVKNGDLELYYGQIYFHCRNSNDIRQFQGLIPLEELKGEVIEKVILIKGSDAQYYHHDDSSDIYVIQAGGKTSHFFARSRNTVGFHHDKPDFDRLVEIGIFSEDDLKDRDTEVQSRNSGRAVIKVLREERAITQEELLRAKMLDRRKIYQEIKAKEARIQELESEVRGRSKWSEDIDYKYLDGLLPSPESWIGRTIKEIHNFQDDEGRKFREPDPLFLVFDDGSVGASIAVMTDQNLKFGLDGLCEAGLISAEEVVEAKRRVNGAAADLEYLEGLKSELAQIGRELEKYGLSQKETMRLVQRKSNLQELIAQEEAEEAVA